MPNCELCGEPMAPNEEMFKYHGYLGPCPKPPLPKPTSSYTALLRRLAADSRQAADVAEPEYATEARELLVDAVVLDALASLLGELERARTMAPDEREILEYKVMTELRTGFPNTRTG